MTEEITATRRRVVAIVGRPNVGKSAIFNRLAGRRIAIVHAQSGVTRDRLMREVFWEDQRFELVDTGGLCNIDNAETRDEINAGIRAQVEVALSDAAVALLVVDIETGIHPLDQEVARMLRKSGCSVLVAANKADNPERDEAVNEFRQLGFDVFPVSALHNRGFEALMAAALRSLPEGESASLENPLKIAVVGRPNVGKSSYINRLLRSDRLIVSSVAGTTRDSVDVPFVIGKGNQARRYLLIDTAGLRPSGKVNSSLDKFSQMRTEKSVERSDIVAVVIAADEPPTEQEKRIVGSAIQNGKGCLLLANKWDLSTITQRAYEREARRVFAFASHCPIVFVSAKSGYNVKRTIDTIDHVAAQVRMTVPTGALNRVIIDAQKKTQPPSIGNRRLNIYYCAQVGVCPVRLRMFVNDPQLATEPYKKYLERMLRDRFGFEGAPLFLQLRARRPSRAGDAG